MGKYSKGKIRTNIDLKYVPSDDFSHIPKSRVDKESGEPIGDPFAYGRKKGRIDPKLAARQSRLYGIGSNIYSSATSGGHNDIAIKRNEYINNQVNHFIEARTNTITFSAKDLETAKKAVVKLIGGSTKGYELVKFKYKKTSGHYFVVIEEIKPTKFKITIQRKIQKK